MWVVQFKCAFEAALGWNTPAQPKRTMSARTTAAIKNYGLATTDGRVPGAYTQDRMSFDFAPVETTTASGKEQTWTVSVTAETADGTPVPIDPAYLEPAANIGSVRGVITTRSWVILASTGEPGKVKTSKPTRLLKGKNLGRANATNAVTQALREAHSKYSKHRRRSGRIGSPAAFPPMLVQPIGSSRGSTLTPADFKKGVTVQRKLDGVRLVAYDDGAVRIYSRTRADYEGLSQIRAELAQLFAVHPSLEGHPLAGCNENALTTATLGPAYLDGEAYLHGKPLEWISGQARRPNDENSLEFWVYDCFFPQAAAAGVAVPSALRQAYLDRLFDEAKAPHPSIRRVENFPATSTEEVTALADRFVKEGYEGAIARKNCAPYRYSYHGYHSPNIVKIKPLFSAEFPVVGFAEGTKGKDKGALIWICEVPAADAVDPNDVRFNVVPKNMTYAERYRLYTWLGEPAEGADGKVNFESFRGQQLTVEFAGRSAKTGKPQQAKALAFRTYEGGPSHDPIRVALDAWRAQE